MKHGVEATLYKVEIEGRGGDSVRDCYFVTHEDAVFASALDGQNRIPTELPALLLSDGTYVHVPKVIHISLAPSQTDIEKLKEKLTPALKLLLGVKG